MLLKVLLSISAAVVLALSAFACYLGLDHTNPLQAALFGNIGIAPFAVTVLTLIIVGANAHATQRQVAISADQFNLTSDNFKKTLEMAAHQLKMSEQSLKHAADVLQHNEQAEVAVRYQRAAELLGSEHVAPRTAAVLLLQDIALKDPTNYYNTVLNLLIVFAEEQTKSTWQAVAKVKMFGRGNQHQSPDWPDVFRQTADDVVAAVNAVGRIRQVPEWRDYEVNWIGADRRLWLRRVVLVDRTIRNGNFGGMDIDDGLFSQVTFAGCNFEGTKILGATTFETTFFQSLMRNMELSTQDTIDTPRRAPPNANAEPQFLDREVRFSHVDLRGAEIRTGKEDVVAHHCISLPGENNFLPVNAAAAAEHAHHLDVKFTIEKAAGQASSAQQPQLF